MAFKLDFEELPNSGIKSLYKFKSFDNNGYYKDLLNNFLWMSTRTELNDPLDCRVKLNYDLCTEAQIKGMMFEMLSDRYPILKKLEIVEKQYQYRKNNIERFRNIMEQRIDDTLGVFSLTQNFNKYMWYKYSDDEKGFCIEFDSQKLYERLDEKYQKRNLRIFILKMTYIDELPEINPCEDTLDEKAKMFLVKTNAWSEEDEWRIVLFDGSKKNEPIAKECITKIYFGLNASEENIKTSIEILKKSNPDIGLYKTVKKKDASELDFEKINT